VRSVVHIERCDQQDVRNGHAGYVQAERPKTTFRYSPENGGAKGQDAQKKKMVVSPTWRIEGVQQD
jgi:hypothetical protein